MLRVNQERSAMTWLTVVTLESLRMLSWTGPSEVKLRSAGATADAKAKKTHDCRALGDGVKQVVASVNVCVR